MDRDNSSLFIEVENAYDKTIEVELDYVRISPKSVTVSKKEDIKSRYSTAETTDDTVCDQEVIDNVSKLFVEIPYKKTESIYAKDVGGEYAFMTINIKNHDGSLEFFCKNHPILKQSKVRIRRAGNEIALLVEQCCTDRRNERNLGKVTVYNDCSKTIWVKIDGDVIRDITKTKDHSVKASYLDNFFFTYNRTTENVVTHIPERPGYTRIDKKRSTNFFLEISDFIDIFVDCEKQPDSDDSCFHRKYSYLKDELPNYPRITIDDSEGRINCFFDTN